MSDFKKKVLAGQLEIIKSYEEILKKSPGDDRQQMQQILNVQKQIARQLGYRPELTAKKKEPSWDIFTKTTKSDGEIPVYENKDVNTKVFDSSVEVEKTEAKAIKNENVNTKIFEQKPVVEESKDKQKANPERLNQTQSKDIKRLAGEGLNAKQISDKLMINQSKVDGILKKMGKGASNLIATSTSINKNKTIEGEKYDKK